MILKRCCVSALLGVCLLQWAVLSHAAQDNGIRQISLGKNHLCAVTTRNELLCWGHNKNGQIGNGKDEGRVFDPTLIIPRGVSAVSAGYAHTCAIVGGALDCWGLNGTGQIGNGKSEGNVLAITRVIASGVTAVSAGGLHTCAVVGEALQCWGNNGYGQIGKGSVGGNVLKPTQVIASGVTAVAAGPQIHTCAVVRGDLLCWGSNRYGQIGIGAISDTVPTPTKILSGGVTAVALGNDYTCAVAKGALLCWGRIDENGIGPNTKGNVPAPRQVIASGVTAVAAGPAHTCAVVGGALQCWGYNSVGGIGTGKWGEVVHSPREVIASGVTAVSAGEFVTCVLVNAALRCRGSNSYAHIETISKNELKPFNLAAGDIRTLDHSVADAAAELEKVPEKIARHLRDRIIVQADGAYYISNARGRVIRYGDKDTARPNLGLELDVSPLFRVRQQRPTGTAVGAVADNVITIPPGAQCATTTGLPSGLNTTEFYVLDENRFSNLKTVLQPVFPKLPDISSDAVNFHVSASDVDKMTSCVKQILLAADKQPFESMRYQVDGYILEVPRSVNASWQHVGGESLDQITVVPKKGKTGVFSSQVQGVSLMQCNDLVLAHWKQRLSSPMTMHSQEGSFLIDNALLEESMREFPTYTLDELRRAINAEQGKTGLASEAQARACLPVIGSETCLIRYNGGVVQQLAVTFETPKSIFQLDCKEDVLCKPLPNNPDKSIVALTYPKNDTSDSQADRYDLAVFVVKTGSHEVYNRFLQSKAYASNSLRFNGLWIDTGRYNLAPGVRAFGVGATYSTSSRMYESNEATLKLFVQEGAVLRPVLDGLVVRTYSGGSEDDCVNHSSDVKRIIVIGASASNGFSDLIVKSTTTESAHEMINGVCTDINQKPQSEEITLRYDGGKYVIPAALQSSP